MPEPTEPMQNCEYFLVNYVPSALRETRIAIGLFLFESSGRLVGHRATRDWRLVRCLDPQADLDLLENLPPHFERLVAESLAAGVSSETSPAEASLYERLRQMQEEYSGALQISQPRGVRTADPEQEFERLFAEHVEPPRQPRAKPPAREGSRPWVRAQLTEALRRHGLWDRFEKDISVEQFTAPGDGFRIDFRYRPNGVPQYLHALSLERDWTQAKLLSYTFWRIRETTEARPPMPWLRRARLTAIVADADAALPSVRSCRRILTEARIALQPVSLLDPFLETVRQEFQSEPRA